MALLKFTTVVALLGLIWAQKTSGLTVSQVMAERAVQAPVVASGPAQYIDQYGNRKISTAPIQYLDEYGNPIFSNSYPFYNSFGNSIPIHLLSNPAINRQLLQLSNKYGIRLSDLYQFYDLANRSMPSLTSDLDLQMLDEIAQVYNQEKLYWSENPYDLSLRSQLSLDELRRYLPPGLPNSYVNMMAYMDYLVPTLSPSAQAAIGDIVAKYCPPSLRSNSDYIAFQMQTAVRYAFASQMKYEPVLY